MVEGEDKEKRLTAEGEKSLHSQFNHTTTATQPQATNNTTSTKTQSTPAGPQWRLSHTGPCKLS